MRSKFFCCQPLSYDSVCQPVHCTCVLLYYAIKIYFLIISAVNFCLVILVVSLYIVLVHCTMSLSIPLFQNIYIWNTVWIRVFILIMLFKLKMSGQTDILLAVMKVSWKCHESDTKVSNWLVSLKLCSDWQHLKEEFQKWHTHTQINKQTQTSPCWTALSQ